MMNGQIDWQALPALVEMFDVKDVERLIIMLMAIRDHNTRMSSLA